MSESINAKQQRYDNFYQKYTRIYITHLCNVCMCVCMCAIHENYYVQ